MFECWDGRLSEQTLYPPGVEEQNFAMVGSPQRLVNIYFAVEKKRAGLACSLLFLSFLFFSKFCPEYLKLVVNALVQRFFVNSVAEIVELVFNVVDVFVTKLAAILAFHFRFSSGNMRIFIAQ